MLVFGGMGSLYNTWLVAATYSDFAPGHYVLLSVIPGIVGIWLLPSVPRIRATGIAPA